MLKRTECIVLRTFPFGEADLIVTHLTPDLGIIKTFAKSSRKTKSRFGSSLEPLTHSRIATFGKEDAALPRLTQSDIIRPFRAVRESLDSFLRVSEIIELTINCMPERDTNNKAYLLLLDTLGRMEDDLVDIADKKNAGDSEIKKSKNGSVLRDLLLCYYKVRFLELAGFAPKLDVCARCSRKGYHFYISQGSVLCEECANVESRRAEIGPPVRLSPPVLRFYADLLTWDVSKIERIKPSAALLAELSGVLNMHIKYVLAKPLKSEGFIQAMG